MTLNLHLLYFVWTEEYCQTSPNKNKTPNLWHVTSILVCCIFGCLVWREIDRLKTFLAICHGSHCTKSLFIFQKIELIETMYKIFIKWSKNSSPKLLPLPPKLNIVDIRVADFLNKLPSSWSKVRCHWL